MAVFKAGLILCLVFVVAVAQHDHSSHEMHNHDDHMVNVAVYYESLCPDSRKFFTQQLYPSLQGNLSHYVNLTLVPYGKTTMEFKTNEHEFTCHHGPSECQGNKIQACALHLIEQGRKSQGLGFNRVTVGFINCLMDKAERKGDQATFPTKECAELNHVAVLDLINNCAYHTDASNYLSNYGALTDAVQKPLKSVPTIVFNNQYKQEDNTLAQTNFVKALCQYINGKMPMECSGASPLAVSLGFLILFSLVPRLFH